MRIHKNIFSGNLCQWDFESPVGTLKIIASDSGLRAILCEEDLKSSDCLKAIKALPEKRSKICQQTVTQLKEYFAGKRQDFDLPMEFMGTDFQKKAWHALIKIPFGKTVSYSEQSEMLGSSRWSRACGMANSKTLFPLLSHATELSVNLEPLQDMAVD